MHASPAAGVLTRSRARITSPSVVLFLALLTSQAAVLVLSPILVEVARDLDVSTAAAGQLRTITGLVAGVTALLAGRVAGRISLRDLLLVGAGLLAASSLASALAPSLLVLAALQVPTGAGLAILLSAGVAGVSEWVREEERPRVLSWALMGQAVAWIVGMPLAGAAAAYTWRLAFIAVPLAASVLALAALLLCRREQLPPSRPPVRLRHLLRERPVALWALAELLAFSAWGGTLVYAGALVIETYDAAAALAGIVLAGAAVAYLPGNVLARRLDPAGSVLPALTLIAAVGVALFGTVTPSLAASALVLAATAFVAGARTFLGAALGLRAAPDKRLAVMGIRAAATQFGYLVGAAAGGLALAASGYPAVGILLAVLFACSGLSYLLLAPGRGRLAPKRLPDPDATG